MIYQGQGDISVGKVLVSTIIGTCVQSPVHIEKKIRHVTHTYNMFKFWRGSDIDPWDSLASQPGLAGELQASERPRLKKKSYIPIFYYDN